MSESSLEEGELREEPGEVETSRAPIIAVGTKAEVIEGALQSLYATVTVTHL
jgi:hypothetical protein